MPFRRSTAFCIWLAVFAVFLIASPIQAEEFRSWTDSTGRFKLEAKLVSLDEGKVTLVKKDGKKMMIDLKKLSQKDQEYVAESQSDNPFEAAEPSPFAPVEADGGMSGNEAVSGPRAVTVDWSRSHAIALSAVASEWNVSLQDAPKLEFRPKAVSLPKKTDFFEKLSGVAVNPVAKKAVVGYTLARPGSCEGTTRIVMCDIEHGRTTAIATGPGQMSPIALHDDGRQVLMRRNEFGFGKQDRLEVWTIERREIAKSVMWTPYGEDKSHGGGRDVMWAEFLDADTLATSSRSGRVAIWSFPAAEPICHFESTNGAVPALSADRKWIAFSTDGRMGIFDVEKREVIAVKETPERLTWPYMAFSPSGQKIGCIAQNRILVWDTASGRLERDFPTPGIAIHGGIDFPNDGFILANKQYLIALESQLKLWHYRGAEFFQTIRGVTFLCVTGGQSSGVFAPAKLPHPEATDLLDKALTQPDLFVFREGTTVKLDVSGIPADQSGRVKDALVKKLGEMNCKVAESGTIELVASVEGPKSKEVSFMHSGTYKVKEYRTRLKFVYQGTPVWETSGTNIPGFVMLKQGENLEGVLRKASKAPSYAFYDGVVLPKLLQKPSENQSAGSGQTLGASQVTPAGFR